MPARSWDPDDPLRYRRWTSRDADADIGSFFNGERPRTFGHDLLTQPGQAGPFVAIWQALAAALRRHDVVEVGATKLRVSTGRQARTVPLSCVRDVDFDAGPLRRRSKDVIQLHLHDGEVLALPDSLYPDAVGDFPSKRHLDRARDVADAIRSRLRSET